MGRAERIAAARSHIASYGTSTTLADASVITAVIGGSGQRQIEKIFGDLTVAMLLDRGASQTSMLSVLPSDYTPESFSRPFVIGTDDDARTWQCHSALPVRDGDSVSYWQLLIYQGGLLPE